MIIIRSRRPIAQIEAVEHEIELFDLEMQGLLTVKKMKGGIFARLGMIGRAIFNLLLLNEITATQAVKILKIVGLDEVKGATSGNMRTQVHNIRKTIKNKNDYKNYPFYPVFWMVPNTFFREEIAKKMDHLKAIEEEYDKQSALIARKKPTDSTKNDGKVILRIAPIEAMHQLAFKVKAYSERYFSDKQEHLELAAYKVYLDTLTKIQDYDENAGQDIDVNALFSKFDSFTEFIIEMDSDYPEMEIADRFAEFLRRDTDGVD